MNRIVRVEVDTTDEIVQVFNRVIDEINELTERMDATKKPKHATKGSSKKGANHA